MQPRAITRWLVLSGLLVIAFAATVTTLNLTLYSSSGFVRSYLDALARHDVDDALATPGVRPVGDTGRLDGSIELVTPSALSDLSAIRVTSDTDDGGGRHTVAVTYSFGDTRGSTTFTVERSGARLGLFSAWKFADSPLSTVAVTPRHAATFDANGIALTPSSGADKAHDYRVLTPAFVELSHTSTYLSSKVVPVLVDRPGRTVAADVDVQANAGFVHSVSKELHRFLAACVTQRVLLPTGCPMGQQITDRLQSDPVWSMVDYPVVTIDPGLESGQWLVPQTPATAHLNVNVRSIFDGSLYTVDEDVPFTIDYLVIFGTDGSPTILPQ